MKKQGIPLIISAILYVLAMAYIIQKDNMYTVALVVGSSFIIYSITSDITSSLVLGLVVGSISLYINNKREAYLEGFEDEKAEEKEAKEEKPAAKVTLPPDNDTRKEFLGLGKKYKAPSEEDDKDFHLDAGTTFLNAYKSLKPDQIAAMTKDTQDLMQTQKQLMSTLNTLKPLIKDGKEMMNMFQSYFGAGDPTTA